MPYSFCLFLCHAGDQKFFVRSCLFRLPTHSPPWPPSISHRRVPLLSALSFPLAWGISLIWICWFQVHLFPSKLLFFCSSPSKAVSAPIGLGFGNTQGKNVGSFCPCEEIIEILNEEINASKHYSSTIQMECRHLPYWSACFSRAGYCSEFHMQSRLMYFNY